MLTWSAIHSHQRRVAPRGTVVRAEIERKFRKTIAEWYKGRFDVDLDPEEEVLPLIGSKEGIAHIPLAFNPPGDYNLIPDPGDRIPKPGEGQTSAQLTDAIDNLTAMRDEALKQEFGIGDGSDS